MSQGGHHESCLHSGLDPSPVRMEDDASQCLHGELLGVGAADSQRSIWESLKGGAG